MREENDRQADLQACTQVTSNMGFNLVSSRELQEATSAHLPNITFQQFPCQSLLPYNRDHDVLNQANLSDQFEHGLGLTNLATDLHLPNTYYNFSGLQERALDLTKTGQFSDLPTAPDLRLICMNEIWKGTFEKMEGFLTFMNQIYSHFAARSPLTRAVFNLSTFMHYLSDQPIKCDLNSQRQNPPLLSESWNNLCIIDPESWQSSHPVLSCSSNQQYGKLETTTQNSIKQQQQQQQPNNIGLCPYEESQLSTSYSPPLNFSAFAVDQNMVCPVCRKCFRFEKNLLRHLQKTHATGNGESVLKCKLCTYTTRHYSNMYVHIRTHTGDKPYSCSACGVSFTQGSSLKLHIKSRHQDNGNYFSLTRKPGKNNLTKLWTRVLKKDLPKYSMLIPTQSELPQYNRKAYRSQWKTIKLKEETQFMGYVPWGMDERKKYGRPANKIQSTNESSKPKDYFGQTDLICTTNHELSTQVPFYEARIGENGNSSDALVKTEFPTHCESDVGDNIGPQMKFDEDTTTYRPLDDHTQTPSQIATEPNHMECNSQGTKSDAAKLPFSIAVLNMDCH